MFYRDPALFGSQAVVDRYVDSFAASFGVPRSDLNVVISIRPRRIQTKLIRRDRHSKRLDSRQYGVLSNRWLTTVPFSC